MDIEQAPSTGELNTWTLEDEAALVACEARIADGMLEMWRGLREINERGLYRKCGTFEQYCVQRWHFHDKRAYQLMDAADLVDEISTTGIHLPSERVARELLKVEPERRLPVLLAAQSASGGKLTSGYIRSAAKVDEQKQATKGYVDIGNGTMTATDAAINQEETERALRQRQHITDGYGDDTCVKLGAFTVCETANNDGLCYVTLRVSVEVLNQLKEGQTGSGVIYLKAVTP